MEKYYIGLESLNTFLSGLKRIFATKDVVVGATSSTNGQSGLVPAPKVGEENKCLLGNGTYGYPDSICTSDDTTFEELESEV